MGDLGGYTVSARCCACKETGSVQTWRGDHADWARHICDVCRRNNFAINDGNLLARNDDDNIWEIIADGEQLESDYTTYKQEQREAREARRRKDG